MCSRSERAPKERAKVLLTKSMLKRLIKRHHRLRAERERVSSNRFIEPKSMCQFLSVSLKNDTGSVCTDRAPRGSLVSDDAGKRLSFLSGLREETESRSDLQAIWQNLGPSRLRTLHRQKANASVKRNHKSEMKISSRTRPNGRALSGPGLKLSFI